MTVPSREGVTDIHVETAGKFMEQLRPSVAPWNDDGEQWAFRGHGDANWKLMPSAVRNPDAFTQYGLPRPDGWSSRRRALDQMLDRFGGKLDDGGFTIPHLPPSRPVPGGAVHSSASPEYNMWPLMALAQHHGLPTLLLDWTQRAVVGAYFAAVDALRHSTEYLAVCAMGRAAGARMQEHVVVRGTAAVLTWYHAPAGTNPNLRAQSGLFTVLSSELDDIGIEEFAAAKDILKLRRLVLPSTEAPELLRLVGREGIDAASMFPRADGIVRAMRERTLWSKRP